MSMHTSLVVPSLAHSQTGIDEVILKRLFQSKPVYVQLNKQIIIEHQVRVSVVVLSMELVQFIHGLTAASAVLYARVYVDAPFLGSYLKNEIIDVSILIIYQLNMLSM